MNCDTAFDLMTDTHGSRSGALAEHFDGCPRCRRMQEALSPALDFMIEEGSLDGLVQHNHIGTDSSASCESFVTTEAVQIAQQAAGKLVALAELPGVRLKRVASRTTKFAAAFAAGVLVAAVLFDQRGNSDAPGAAVCTRREASKDGPPRTTGQIQALAQSCAVCHQSSPGGRDDHSANSPVHRPGPWDWLLPYLEVQPEPVFENREVDFGRMIAGLSKHIPDHPHFS